VFNQTVLQFFPAFLAMRSVVVEDFKAFQIVAIDVVQGDKVDKFLAEE
jgi:hypothetical protein